jgi:hypothetical protein
MGHAQPQKSLLPIMLNTEIKARIVRKITGTCQPAFRNRKGLVIEQTGLGCRPIPHANLPRGNAGSIPKAKKAAARNRSLIFRHTHDFIKSPNPIKQKIALTQTRGNNKTSRNPIDLLPPSLSAQAIVAISSNTVIVLNINRNFLYVRLVLHFIFYLPPFQMEAIPRNVQRLAKSQYMYLDEMLPLVTDRYTVS